MNKLEELIDDLQTKMVYFLQIYRDSVTGYLSFGNDLEFRIWHDGYDARYVMVCQWRSNFTGCKMIEVTKTFNDIKLEVAEDVDIDKVTRALTYMPVVKQWLDVESS